MLKATIIVDCAEGVPSKPPHSASQSIDLQSNKLACKSTKVKKLLTGKGDTFPEFSQSSTISVRVSVRADQKDGLGVT